MGYLSIYGLATLFCYAIMAKLSEPENSQVIATERDSKLHACMCLSEDPILDSGKTIQCTQEIFQGYIAA